jgi:Ser/Thr protein kinase RdoA (MazF antagonist)
MEDTINQIELAYGFSIKAVIPAPRGFLAETFFIKTDNETYFLKIHKNYPWESTLRASLDIQYQMTEQIKYIPKPIKTKDNLLLYTLDVKRVVTLYTHIDGTNYITNDACEILNLMAGIYNLNIKCENIYDFKFYAKQIIEDMQINKFDTKSEILRSFLEHNREVYIKYWDIYKNLVNKVRSTKRKFYLTHGDIAKNLMIDKNKQVSIIDWDRIRLGPIELDLSEFIDNNTNIKRLENIAKSAGIEWEFNVDYHNYFILNGLYYNLRNLHHDNITMENLIGHQQYIDKIRNKVIMK